MKKLFLTLLLSFILLGLYGQNQEKRTALLFGNSNYNGNTLVNPANDAIALGSVLESLGFEVMVYTNLSMDEMKKQIREFGTKIWKDKGAGLFYYSGHGIQVNGENYLIPIDAIIEKEQDVELECINLKRVLGEMEYAQNQLNILILDASRNNPFTNGLHSSDNKGFAYTESPANTFIAFATGPGKIVEHSDKLNSLYTSELIKAIQIPNLKIEDVFKKVRREVLNATNGQQIPWENSSVSFDFYFNKK